MDERPTPTLERELLAELPPPRQVPGALDAIRSHNTHVGTRVVAFDDDPTGSQTVRDVPVLTLAGTPAETGRAATRSTPAAFVLTNSRSLDASAAATLAAELTEAVLQQADGTDVRLLSRSDSTLRGHFPVETDAMLSVAARTGRRYDGVLLCPAFPEAGRLTVGDVQWVRDGDVLVPAVETVYAADPTFGYSEPTLPEWVAARTGRTAAEVASVSIDDLREGGVAHVAALLGKVSGGGVVVANAADVTDLEVLCLAVQHVEAGGTRLLYRTGPSFVRVRAGLSMQPPLTTADVYPDGVPRDPGLVVVGSHVPLTTRQLSTARSRHDVREVELRVAEVTAGGSRAAHEIARCAHQLAGSLADGDDTVLVTSRELVRAASARADLGLAQLVSVAVTDAVASALDRYDGPLRYLLAKGGITSAELATRTLGMHSAIIAGQLAAGKISVWRPRDGRLPGTPYVVFPGNVGDDSTLADVLDTLARPAPAARHLTEGSGP